MSDAELAFKTGCIFNKKITSAFWSSFKGDYGRVQIEVLVLLSEVKCVQSSKIVTELNISKQHVSKIIKEFVSEGYVEVFPNPEDKRSNLISITESGQKLLNEHIKISNQSFNEIVSKMNDAEKKQFIDALETVYSILKNH